MSTCTCIIPFYNEEDRIISVLSELSKIKEFDEIILVNDWSTDNGSKLVKDFIKDLQHIKLIEYQPNHWKSHAVKQWLLQAKSDYVFFFDADLKWVKHGEISRVVTTLYNHPELDIWILRRIHSKRYLKIFMIDLLLSWERMLKIEDAKKIFSNQVSWYEMEMAINSYIVKEKKNGAWFPSSARNTFKIKKYWTIDWLIKEFRMYRNIFRYKGFFECVKTSTRLVTKNIQSYKKID